MRLRAACLAAFGLGATCVGCDFAPRAIAQDDELPTLVAAAEPSAIDDGAAAVPVEGEVGGETSAGPAAVLGADGLPIFGVDIPIEDTSGTALRSFHAALRRAASGEGQARIVV